MKPTIVDSHVHVWQATGVLYPARRRLGDAEIELDAPAGLLLREMEIAGVEGAILVQPSNYGFDNRYLADCLRRYPGRFAGVARLDPVDASAPSRLTLWAEEHGIRGLRIAPFRILDAEWVTDPRIAPLWDKVAELTIPVCFQGSRGRLGALVALIEKLIERHPGLEVALDHMGHFQVGDGVGAADFQSLLGLGLQDNVYVKVSGHYALSAEPYPHRDTWPFMQALYDTFGPQRLMWGSDFPYILQQGGYTGALGLLLEALPTLSDADKAWILGGTATTLWELGAGA